MLDTAYARPGMSTIDVRCHRRAPAWENAIDLYGLDRGVLDHTTERIRPVPGELFSDQPVDPNLILDEDVRRIAAADGYLNQRQDVVCRAAGWRHQHTVTALLTGPVAGRDQGADAG